MSYIGNSCFSLVNYFNCVKFSSTNGYWKPTYLPPGSCYFLENVVHKIIVYKVYSIYIKYMKMSIILIFST